MGELGPYNKALAAAALTLLSGIADQIAAGIMPPDWIQLAIVALAVFMIPNTDPDGGPRHRQEDA